MYASVEDETFKVPAVPWQKIDSQFLRQVIPNPTGEREGTLVVDTSTHHLYFTLPGGHAMRYGVGLGRAGFEWSGLGIIKWKQKWPTWKPPKEMIERDPKLEKWSEENGGQPGGLKNPLGARALYIFQGEVDTLFRVHGSPDWKSIGKSVSSGCVRMINQDVMDLYEWVDKAPVRVPIKVVNGLGGPVATDSAPSTMPIDDGWPVEPAAVPIKPI
jgi:lipoprotein-anchoring transpeptidase ErfK/SrfK